MAALQDNKEDHGELQVSQEIKAMALQVNREARGVHLEAHHMELEHLDKEELD